MYPYNDLTMSSWTERACSDTWLGEDRLTIRQMHQIKQKIDNDREELQFEREKWDSPGREILEDD